MHWRMVGLVFAQACVYACFCPVRLTSQVQDFRLFGRDVQAHGFASQGIVYTNTNNWLTMNSSQGSAAFTDFGFNLSTSVTDKLRVGAQLYDRNLGQLGQYHPSLDWAVADYRFKSWLGIRGGKVKTTSGLYNDTQDLDFLRTFALLPQSVYPTDLRDATIAHTGGDVYGNVSLEHGLGDLSYTAYAGYRTDSLHSGYAYLATQYGVHYSYHGGLQYGADLRWKTPLKGLLIGESRIDEDLSGKARFMDALNSGTGSLPYSEVSKADWTNQFYGEYSVGKLRIDCEYRRYWHDAEYRVGLGGFENATDVRGWYVSGTYRVMKRIGLGSYYSRYSITSVSAGSDAAPNQTNTNLPANHIYDKVVSARVDLRRFWNVKVEGHFMNGYGASTFPDGFYPEVNPQGFKPNTNALVVKTGVNF